MLIEENNSTEASACTVLIEENNSTEASGPAAAFLALASDSTRLTELLRLY